jgi:5'-nucleotidase
VDLVISGINHGMNLGEDVHISGTVGAALQGYLRGFTSLAISAPFGNSEALDVAAKVAAILAGKITGDSLPNGIFLNINLPDIPLVNISSVKITRLSIGSHINTVEEGNDGNKEYYWLMRQRVKTVSGQETDIWAIDQGNISITPLYLRRSGKPSLSILNNMCSDILQELRK